MILWLLAQLPTATPLSLGNWVVDAAAVVLILERGFAFWKNHLREQPPPSSTYMTKEECARNHLGLTARLHGIEEQGNEADGRRRAIYEQIDRVRRELKADISHLQDNLAQTPEAVIRMLRQTGVIKE